MKKTLLLSTALVAFAGMAVADVSLSGRAEMGIFGTNLDTGDIKDDPDFFTDIDVTFTMSGETDGGLVFGATVDLDEVGSSESVQLLDDDNNLIVNPAIVDGATNNNDDDGGATMFISGGFGTFTMGDTDGALDFAIMDTGDINNGGSINDDETEHVGYFGAYHDAVYDNQIARYDYSFGDWAFAVSAEMDDSDTNDDRDTGYAAGVKWAGELGGTAVNAGLGYQSVDLDADDGDNENIWAVSLGADFDMGLAVGAVYVGGDVLGVDDSSYVGLGIGYTTGALTLHANWGQFDLDDDDRNPSGFGLSAAYDLGGGAVVHAGYGSSDFDDSDVDDFDRYSFGLGLSF